METCEHPRICDMSPALERSHVRYSAYGVTLAIEVDPDLLDSLPSPLIPGASLQQPDDQSPAALFTFHRVTGPDGAQVYAAAENGAYVFATPDLDAAVRAFESRIHQYVAAESDQFVFVHAGVVCHRGEAILIPGRSHSGKSTLIAALVESGLEYYSDEYAILDLDGRVHAFPRQLRLRPDMAVPGGPAVAGNVEATNALPVRWVFHIQHKEDAIWDPRPLNPGETLLALLENTVAVRRQSELTVKTLKLAVSSAKGVKTERAGASAAAAAILRMVEGAE